MGSIRNSFDRQKPRHYVVGGESAVVELRRYAGRTPDVLTARLLDFSRQGAKLELPTSLVLAEPVVLRLRPAQKQMEWEFPANILWQRAVESGAWLVGCRFSAEVSFETLGELFLNGILSDKPSASPVA